MKICPTGCNINNILDSLLELFDSALQDNTITFHRSAMPAFHDKTGAIKFRDHSFKNFCFNDRGF